MKNTKDLKRLLWILKRLLDGDRRSIADARVFLADYRDALKKKSTRSNKENTKRKIFFNDFARQRHFDFTNDIDGEIELIAGETKIWLLGSCRKSL